MNIAIIPARGGSKRLPKKNIKLLAGKPMIAWTIEAALDSQVFERVFVSTDCEEIAKIARGFGAEVPFLRPIHLATDEATTNDVTSHLIEWFEKYHNIRVARLAILQPTSPLRNALHIREAAGLMEERKARAVVSVCKLEHPIEFCNRLDYDGSMNGFIKPDNVRPTQKFETYYRLNGAIYLFERDYVGKLGEIYSQGTYPYVMSSLCSLDIDVDDDFKKAELMIKLS